MWTPRRVRATTAYLYGNYCPDTPLLQGEVNQEGLDGGRQDDGARQGNGAAGWRVSSPRTNEGPTSGEPVRAGPPRNYGEFLGSVETAASDQNSFLDSLYIFVTGR